MASRFTAADWLGIANDLRGAAEDWWRDNKDNVIALGREEVAQIAAALRKGELTEAKLEIAARMSPTEWRAYRDGTTKQLRAIAKQRAALLEALNRLGKRAAKSVGKAVLSRLLG